jgi:hypothetical protein
MTASENLPSQEILSPKEIRQWAQQEITNSAKAFELRVKEATSLATQYAAGELSADEATQKLTAYGRRWGEAMHGVYTTDGLSNEQLLAMIDQAREKTRSLFAKRESHRDALHGRG